MIFSGELDVVDVKVLGSTLRTAHPLLTGVGDSTVQLDIGDMAMRNSKGGDFC